MYNFFPLKFCLLPIGAFFINGNQYDESTPKKAQFDKSVKHFTFDDDEPL